MKTFTGPFWYGIDGDPERGPVPLDYKSPGYYDCTAIFDANGEKVVGCGEYMIFNGVEAVNLLLDALNKP